jgi:DedD protein
VNDILKQRLVGALVLIALGVTFWPVIFVESERGDLDRNTQIEPMPVLEDVVIPAPKPLEGVDPVSPEQHAILPDDSETAAPAGESAPLAAAEAAVPAKTTVPDSRPALDEQGIPVAWVLQVASVSTREKAEQLTAELVGEGYKAYHRAIRRNGEVLHRVFIGPVFEREKLVAIKRDIDQKLKVSAIIARYVP